MTPATAPTARDTPTLPPECAALGIRASLIDGRPLAVFEEGRNLICAHVSASGREYLLTKEAAAAWTQLRTAAANDGVSLILLSAFRSIARQAELIRARCAEGRPLDEVLQILAPPGFSEHHTGRAIDLGTPGCPPADPAFDQTPAFAWLCDNAARFNFVLSYPRGNPQGFVYEPWHWCFHAKAAT